MIELIKAFPGSLTRRYRWQAGDGITHLDGLAVEDILDLYHYVPESETMTLTIARADGKTLEVELPPDSLDSVTASFAPMEFKTCACKCVFCFVDQNPSSMRDQIYVKDEDYRFSFLYGNYITLTSLGRKGLQRVIDQRMSPLYVSVHATDTEVRTRMLGIKRKIDVVQILGALVANGIEVHSQVVLCPGWNDGAILDKTVNDLLSLATTDTGEVATDQDEFPGTRGGVCSLAIVPVGLSAHRQGLAQLDPVTPGIAQQVIDQISAWQRRAQNELGKTFVHLSDEFYLLAGEPLPPVEQYDDFPQVDNGIGLTAHLRETWSADLAALGAAGRAPTLPLTILTGELAAGAFAREIQPALAASGAPPLEVIGVSNDFYGNSVTVAGLMTGGDLRRALLALPDQPRRTVALSPRVFNVDDLTLDDLGTAEITADQPHRVVVPPEEGFVDFWAGLT